MKIDNKKCEGYNCSFEAISEKKYCRFHICPVENCNVEINQNIYYGQANRHGYSNNSSYKKYCPEHEKEFFKSSVKGFNEVSELKEEIEKNIKESNLSLDIRLLRLECNEEGRSDRISDLENENQSLKNQVKNLENSVSKLEKYINRKISLEQQLMTLTLEQNPSQYK